MKFYVVRSALLAALLGCAGGSLAADTQPGAPADTKSASHAKAPATKAKSPYASDPKQKVVDINSATKRELLTLPYIDDATVDKIIAGRPYLSKAHLVSRKIIGAGPYQVIAKRIVARQESKPKS